MDFVLQSLRADWQAFLTFSPRLVYAVAVLCALWLVGGFTGRLIARVMRHSERFRPNERFAQRLVTWAIRVTGSLLALGVMGLKGVAASLLATGGVMAIVLGFAFREIGENLLAGIFLTFSRPFERGDLIKTGDLTGTVRTIDIRSVHIRTSDACDVFVPSAQIFRQELYNYTRDGLRRPDFTIGVAYHDDPEQVIGLLETATRGVSDVLDDPRAIVLVQAFDANYIVYQVFFWMDTNRSTMDLVSLTNEVKLRCWRALLDADLTFSTDVSTALDIRSVPALSVENAPAAASGD